MALPEAVCEGASANPLEPVAAGAHGHRIDTHAAIDEIGAGAADDAIVAGIAKQAELNPGRSPRGIESVVASAASDLEPIGSRLGPGDAHVGGKTAHFDRGARVDDSHSIRGR